MHMRLGRCVVDIDDWLELYSSENQVVRLRAADALLRRSGEAPLAILLDILDNISLTILLENLAMASDSRLAQTCAGPCCSGATPSCPLR